MKKQFYLHLLITAWMLSVVAHAQSPEQKHKLKQLADEWETVARREKAEADAKALQMGWPLRTEDEQGRISELIRLDEGRPVYVITDNAGGAALINTDDLFSGGGAGLSLSGSGQILGIWDGGSVYSAHQELSGRITQKDVPAGQSWHASHVAGTMIASGINSSAKGMSPAASLYAYDWDYDETEMASEALAGLKVSQHSYGLITGWASGDWSGNTGWHWWGLANLSQTEDAYWGYYSDEAEDWDNIAHNAPNYLIVKSAGNDRGEGPASGATHYYRNPNNSWAWEASTTVRDKDGGTLGYESISHAATAKNIMTVGAVDATTSMSSFSGWGPTDDGRIKPDIVAKGVSVYSCNTNSTASYAYSNGTSMSGPMVSGSVGLLLEHQQNLHPGIPLRSATLKGLILHTATDLGNAGPDYTYGWGLMNTRAAADIITDQAASPVHIYENNLANGNSYNLRIKASGGTPLRATIIWNDIPGTSPPMSLDPTDLMLVNDLDMRISTIDGAIAYPYVLNPASPATAATTGDNFRDNIEVITIASPEAKQWYDISISHKNTLSGGSQDYTLIITGNEAFEYTYIYEASDKAANYNSWTSGSNEGEGFGSWTLSTGGAGGNYLGATGLGSSTFGLYAGATGGSNYSSARRDLLMAIPVGSSFSLDLGYTGVANGGEIGINLFAGGSFRLGFKFIGGGSSWQLNDGGSDFSTGINWSGNTPLSFQFTRGSGNLYSVQIDQGAQSYTGSNYTSSSGTMNIDRIEVYTTGQGSSENVGFDNPAVHTNFATVAANADVVVRGLVELDADLILDNLLIENGDYLNIQPNGTLTVEGSIDNQAGAAALELQSDATGTASLLHNTNALDLTIKRYLTGSTNLNDRKYHTVSIPLSQASNPVTGLFTGSYLYSFDQASQAYVSAGTSTSTPLNVDQGYLVYYPGISATYSFTGIANNGSFATDVEYPAFGNNFNLVPNPYPSAIDWDAASGWTKTNMAGAIYIYNSALSNSGSFVWASYVGGSGTNGGSRYIPSGQAFFVQSSASSPALGLTNATRVHSSQAFLKSPEESVEGLKIIAQSQGQTDESIVKILSEATDDFDNQYDALKLRGTAGNPTLYSLASDNTELSINSIPYSNQSKTVLLGFEMQNEKEVQFDFGGIGGFPEWMTVFFEDIITGQMIDLRQTSTYNFSHQPANDPKRFRLHFMGATGVMDSESTVKKLRAYTIDNLLFIILPDDDQRGIISIYEADGRLTEQISNINDKATVVLQSRGKISIIRFAGQKNVYFQKVIQQ